MTTMRLLHLTRVESLMFDKILRKGETSLGKVIKELGIHKGTAYNSIRRWQKKGLISHRKIAGLKRYSINLFALKKRRDEEINQHKEEIKKLDDLIKITKLNDANEESKIDVFIGEEGFKSFFESLYRWAYTTKKEYLFIGRGNEIIEKLGLWYYKITQEKKRRLKIRCRILLSKKALELPVKEYVSGDVRYIETQNQSPSSIWIYGKNVTLVLWEANPLTTIHIRSKEAANSFRNYFENLWYIAYGPKMVFESRHKINIYEFINKASESLDILGMVCLEAIHEGRSKIIWLLNNKKKVRVLMADPKSSNFKKRVALEEQYIRYLKQSRILFEWKAAFANLKDIYMRTNKNKLLEVRIYTDKHTVNNLIVDKKVLLNNEVKEKKSEYGSSQQSFIINKDFDRDLFEQLTNRFEEVWSKI